MRLPKYEDYKKRLENYAKAHSVKLEYGDEDIFIPSRNKIRLDANSEESTEIAALLHELGHFLDFLTVNPQDTHRSHKAYEAYYKSKHTAKDGKLVLASEKKAWDLGREIAKRLKIRLGKWYDREEKAALKAYREDM